MSRNLKRVPVARSIIAILVLLNAALIRFAYISGGSTSYWLLAITIPLLLIAIYNVLQRRHAVLRNFPLIGYFRYWVESVRPELRQYLFEDDLDGRPFSRRQRSLVYQRSKNEAGTVPFGTQMDTGRPGYEWVAHSILPVVHPSNDALRVWIGNKQCQQPYYASILNIGAMSFGALSKTAVSALNEGAALGHFAHNTGEGGISPYHLRGGDLVWQIGTGYFGCRNDAGAFDPALFRKYAQLPQVKMIELKLSQGAKPGHGGILPAAKNTPEIAAIRKVKPGTTVLSPAIHTAFMGIHGMIRFVGQLRDLSGGKPVGFKLCLGDKDEFVDICEAIRDVGIIPDFITIDGAEGGTGAAPLEFSDRVGLPLYDALSFAWMTLTVFGLNKDIALLAAGKVIDGFDILKLLALGAKAVYSARGMMFSLGCLQALQCDKGTCPAGVATQDPNLYKGLDVTDKRVRVANFHFNTVKATRELMEACGFRSTEEVTPSRFFRKVDAQQAKTFEEIYFRKLNLSQPGRDSIPTILN